MFPTNPYALRIRNLMDLMHHPDWLRAAAERVMRRSRNKAPGVDGVTPQVFRKGYEEKIEALRLELKHGTYQPQPVRRVMIPKANGKMRALGIPTWVSYCTYHSLSSEFPEDTTRILVD